MNVRTGTRKIRVLLVGCGAIGGALAHAIIRKPLSESFRLVGLCDIVLERARALSQSLDVQPDTTVDYRSFLRKADLIIEAASGSVSGGLAEEALRMGKDVLVLSAGGLLGNWKHLRNLARSRKAHLYVPSGALAGLDAVRAMRYDGLKRVKLVTRKPPRGFAGNPHVAAELSALDSTDKEVCLFSGSVDEAVRRFPQNINVAALLELGVEGRVPIEVHIYASPQVTANTHELCLEGDSGTVRLKVENIPSPDNPKTSRLAILSIIATLNRISDYVGFGS